MWIKHLGTTGIWICYIITIIIDNAINVLNSDLCILLNLLCVSLNNVIKIDRLRNFLWNILGMFSLFVTYAKRNKIFDESKMDIASHLMREWWL